MKKCLSLIKKIICLGLFACAAQLSAQSLYTQSGTDLSWETIIRNGMIPRGTNSTAGIRGSTIDVNNAVVEQGPYGNWPFVKAINIHTVGNSVVPRNDFAKWSRWYQEDGNTQVFRLFKGEYNVRNDRENAARIESFSQHSWNYGDGWQEWVGTYTIVKPIGCAIFQAKNPVNDWSVMITLSENGTITYQPRHGTNKTIATNMAGKSFNLRVRDNGLHYEVYMNGSLVGTGSFSRPTENTSFRWGMYVGNSIPSRDGMIFVTGATINPRSSTNPCDNNPLPTVTLSSNLATGNLQQGTSLTFTANASDNGTISKVEFFDGTTLLGTDLSAPYTFATSSLAVGSHSITAKATDNCGGIKISNALSYTVQGMRINTPPVVAFSSPAANARLTAPASLGVIVAASDPDAGDRATVALYLNNTFIREDLVAPHEFNTSGTESALQNLAAGSYVLKAIAKDTHGDTAMAFRTIIVENANDPCAGNTAPSIRLNNPASASISEGNSITLAASASDNGSISKVEFFDGNTLIASDLVAPYEFTTNALSAGTHIISAKATDHCGASSSSETVQVTVVAISTNHPPVISFSSPAANTRLTAPASLGVVVAASDVDAGDRATVALYLNNTFIREDLVAPHEFNTNGTESALQNLAAGTYVLKAIAKDTRGDTAMAFRTVVVENPADPCAAAAAPLVRIASSNGQSSLQTGQSLTLVASISGGLTISKVEFYNGSTLIEVQTASPYQANVTNLSAGTYTFQARAYEACGRITNSAEWSVQVTTPSSPILGPSCARPNQTLSFELSSAVMSSAKGVSWWFSGSSQRVTPSASGNSCVVVTSQYYTNGEICAGVKIAQAPYFVKYCKALSSCAREGYEVTPEEYSSDMVYPNPSADGIFHLSMKDDGTIPYNIDLLDARGIWMKQIEWNKSTSEISLQSLAPGHYFLKIAGSDGIRVVPVSVVR
ncbi:MAG: Ig-like domain-containing protein [Cytophagaceae bacterium]|jgi:hypothetical protein|nr:Ig-like domain-containing protein [Cytophagaceae bacterium]